MFLFRNMALLFAGSVPATLLLMWLGARKRIQGHEG